MSRERLTVGLVSRVFLAFCLGLFACFGPLHAKQQEGDKKGRLLMEALELSQKDPEGALGRLSSIQEPFVEPSDAPVFKQALLNIAKVRPFGAMEVFLKHEPIFLPEDDPGFFLEVAGLFEKAGLGHKAIELYEKSYRHGVDGATLPLMKLLETLKDWDRILEHETEITMASLSKQDQKEIFGILGNAFLETGKPKEAITHLLQAKPTLKNYLRRGMAFMALNHTDAADEAFSAALDMALNQNDAESLSQTLLLKAQNLEKAKRYAQAASHYGLYLKKFPKDPFGDWARLRMGMATFEAGDPKSAKPLLLPLTKSKDKGVSGIARALVGFLDVQAENL